jgi:hypothetical protein
MPNWVRSELAISGERAELDRFIELARNDNYYHQEEDPKDRVTFFDFGKFMPRPAEEDDNWYDWNCENWGTKWNAKFVELDNDCEELIIYRFETAWNRISNQLWDDIKSKFPKLDFSFVAIEEGGFFWSRTEDNGEIESYSFPSIECPNLLEIAQEYRKNYEDWDDDCLIRVVAEDLIEELQANYDGKVMPNGNFYWKGKEILSCENAEKLKEVINAS